jgi:1,2-diacylglycerol 3-beta-galactosyltransferase
MVAADVLVTKAGPGTIAEAAAVGLPIMLTSFLPGQEAGNVDYVLDYGFGDYCEDPVSIAEEVATWLQDPTLLEVMSHRAQAAGRPHAASDIVLDIGSETHVWKALNGANGGVSS